MTRIPRLFHFVFGLRPQTEPFHLMHYLCIASCLAVNKPDRIMFHFQHLPWGPWWDRIMPYLQLHEIKPDQYLSDFSYDDPGIARYRYAHLADISRLEILIEHGGTYADIDTLFINRIPDHLFAHPFVMGEEKVDWTVAAARAAGGSLCNALMMAAPQSEFARCLLDRTYESFDGSWSAHSTFLPYQLSREHPDWIHVEPQRSFFLYDWTPEGIRGIFEDPPPNLDGVYSIHLWSHMWWDRKRIDTSCFHEGRLTPEYVQFDRSAYARQARPFMPQDMSPEKWTYFLQKTKALQENAVWTCKDRAWKISRLKKGA